MENKIMIDVLRFRELLTKEIKLDLVEKTLRRDECPYGSYGSEASKMVDVILDIERKAE